ncbi:hypothetical protein MXZ84_10650 [Streptococcus uberis]|nr:hypothetical protein [Streptococcus uberis]MCK1203026.1 hypothetical protein [Streptococcus uberis]
MLKKKKLTEFDFDLEDANSDYFIGKKMSVSLSDMDYHTWRQELVKDLEIINDIEKNYY